MTNFINTYIVFLDPKMLLLSYRCIVTINVLWLFLTVPWVGLQYVIVVFPDHTHLHFRVHQTLLIQKGYIKPAICSIHG